MTNGFLVCVVEDDPAMRDALKVLLETAGFTVCSYGTAEQFLAEADCSSPYCLLADVRLPGMDGIALYRYLLSTKGVATAVMITGHGDVCMAVSALKHGVADFIEKPFDPAVLLDSIREASQRAVAVHQRKLNAAEIERRVLGLTPRERGILDLLVEGAPNKRIAAKLGISVRTAEHHRARIMEKMEARSLSHLIRLVLAINAG
jgi:two-component system response regulator FixJ